MIFKVDSLQTSKMLSSSHLKKTKSLSSFGVQIGNSNESTSAAETASTNSASALAALQDLLNLQEVSLEDFPLKRSPERGNRLLEELEKLQQALLRGNLEPAALHHLKEILSKKPINADNPQLNDLVQEIEQRLAIEMAKIEKYSF